MSLTKRHTAFLAVFLLGLVALAADRTILRPHGGPGAASADSDPTQAVTQDLPPLPPLGNVPVLQDQPRRTGLAERLAGLGSWNEARDEGGPPPNDGPDALTTMRNPFALPVSWFDKPGETNERIPDAAVQFIQTHQLAAVVRNGGEFRALVDDRFLIPGQTVDGFTLVSVGDRSAVFERNGVRAILELPNK